MPAVGLDRLVHLDCQFARRRQHQHADRVASGRRTWAGEGKDALQQRQREGGRLAGAGLRATHQILTGENDGYRLGLDRGRLRVALVGNGFQQLRRQAEFIKMHRRCVWHCRCGRRLVAQGGCLQVEQPVEEGLALGSRDADLVEALANPPEQRRGHPGQPLALVRTLLRQHAPDQIVGGPAVLLPALAVWAFAGGRQRSSPAASGFRETRRSRPSASAPGSFAARSWRAGWRSGWLSCVRTICT
jgi:hypothetical protein